MSRSTAARTRLRRASRSTPPTLEGVLYAHGGVAGGHSLYVKDKKLRYTFNWLGTKLYDIVADTEISPGSHVFTAEFASKGQSTDPTMPGFAGTLTLYVDTNQVGEGEIVTQPGNFCLVGDGICVGRDSASPVTPEYTAPFRVHRRHHRQGRRRRLRREVRRPRSPGRRLVQEGLRSAGARAIVADDDGTPSLRPAGVAGRLAQASHVPRREAAALDA